MIKASLYLKIERLLIVKVLLNFPVDFRCKCSRQENNKIELVINEAIVEGKMKRSYKMHQVLCE